MTLLVILLLPVVIFLWLLVRVCRSGGGRIIGYLAWLMFGMSVAAGTPAPAPLAAKVVVHVWAWSLVVVPLWWVISGVRKAVRGQ